MAQVVETLSASFFLANKKLVMVKKIDNFKIYKKAFVGLTAGVLIVGILGGAYIGICKVQHNNMYNKVESAGFTKELTEDFIERYKGDMDITINIDENRKIFLALYPGEIEVDEKGNVIDTSKKLTDVQKEHMDDLLTNRKEEILPIVKRALELWDTINK